MNLPFLLPFPPCQRKSREAERERQRLQAEVRSLQRLSQMEGEAPQQVNVTDLEEDLKVGRKGVGGGGREIEAEAGQGHGQVQG